MKRVALGLAVIAVALAAIAVVVVVERGPSAPSAPRIDERSVTATDVLALALDAHTRFDAQGARVDNPELARRLGLAPGDVIVALSGRPIGSSLDVERVAALGGRTIFAEVARGGTTTLARWRITGDIWEAQRAAMASLVPGPAPAPDPAPGPLTDPAPDPSSDPVDALLATIERLDDTHVRLPRATVQALVADPMSVARGARIVPALRDGHPDGLKLYAIRPRSVFAHLGFENGDTIRTINGVDLTDANKALDAYASLKDASQLDVEIMRRGQPLTIHFTIH